MELRDRVTKGVTWSIAEKVASALLQMVVSIVVARMLAPQDFGTVAILVFFTAVASVVVDSGFSQTLIRKSRVSNDDFRSVFIFNITFAAVVYVALVATSPAVARFYELPIIRHIAPVIFLVIPFAALGAVQSAVMARNFQFAAISQINFAASFVSGVAAIALALCGCHVWSLVWQRLLYVVVRSLLLWYGSSWRGEGRVSLYLLRDMAPFSLRLMATDTVAAVYANISQMFIGKIYSPTLLGYFNQGQKLKDLPVNALVQSVQSVTYPALSNIADNREKFAESYRIVLLATAAIVMPIMVGMIAVADDMFVVLLGERWLPTVPYFRILALGGVCYPLSMVAMNVLKVYSNGSIIIRLEIVKKVVMTLIFAITIPLSAEAVAWGLTAMLFIELVMNIAASLRYVALGIVAVARTLLTVATVTAVMYLAVVVVGELISHFTPIWRLLIEILTGIATYVGVALLFRAEFFRVLSENALRLLRPKNG